MGAFWNEEAAHFFGERTEGTAWGELAEPLDVERFIDAYRVFQTVSLGKKLADVP